MAAPVVKSALQWALRWALLALGVALATALALESWRLVRALHVNRELAARIANPALPDAPAVDDPRLWIAAARQPAEAEGHRHEDRQQQHQDENQQVHGH